LVGWFFKYSEKRKEKREKRKEERRKKNDFLVKKPFDCTSPSLSINFSG